MNMFKHNVVMLDKLKNIFGEFPYVVRSVIKAVLAPGYYYRIIKNDLMACFGPKRYGVRIIFIAGMPKSGTTWVENFVSRIPGYNPRVLSGSREILRQHNLPHDAFSKIPKYGYSAIKTHTDPTKENVDVLVENGISKILVMHRDLRDVVVSSYYYVLKNNPWKPSDEHYVDYSTLSKEEGMSHSLDLVIRDYIPWIKGWLNISIERNDLKCKMIKYEDLVTNPVSVFHDITFFFEIGLNESDISNILSDLDGKKLKEKSFLMLPGQKTTKRKGRSGEWKSELNETQKQKMKKYAGQLLIELGYEENLEW